MAIEQLPRTTGACETVSRCAPARPFCLDVCAGSARLTSVLRSRALDEWGLDHADGRLTPETAAVLIDKLVFMKLLSRLLLMYVIFAPQSGTCSAARDQPVRGAPGGVPPPLRFADIPLCFPDLAQRLPRESSRVLAADAIYQVIAHGATSLAQRVVAWSTEKPRSSYLWNAPLSSV